MAAIQQSHNRLRQSPVNYKIMNQPSDLYNVNTQRSLDESTHGAKIAVSQPKIKQSQWGHSNVHNSSGFKNEKRVSSLEKNSPEGKKKRFALND